MMKRSKHYQCRGDEGARECVCHGDEGAILLVSWGQRGHIARGMGTKQSRCKLQVSRWALDAYRAMSPVRKKRWLPTQKKDLRFAAALSRYWGITVAPLMHTSPCWPQGTGRREEPSTSATEQHTGFPTDPAPSSPSRPSGLLLIGICSVMLYDCTMGTFQKADSFDASAWLSAAAPVRMKRSEWGGAAPPNASCACLHHRHQPGIAALELAENANRKART
jgi:hypothetical protein